MKIKVNDKFMNYLVTHKIKVGTDSKKSKKRMGSKKTQKNVKKNYVYYGMLACMVVVSIASVSLAIKTYGKFSKEDYKYYSDEGKTVESNNIASSSAKVDENKKENLPSVVEKGYEKPIDVSVASSTNVVKEKEPKKKEEVVKPKVPVLNFIKPLAGEISKSYSKEEVVFWKTLNTWKIHEGVDILAEKGTSVKSIEAGSIESIKNDPLFGITIILDHGQGYKSIYCNLDSDVSLKEKDNIKKGQIIAKVGDTAIGEIKEESHLHFELKKNGTIIDPNKLIKF